METAISELMSPKSSTGVKPTSNFDSENDLITDSDTEPHNNNHAVLLKRPNKRKNFQPRCSSFPIIYHNNNNEEIDVDGQKTLAAAIPIDLSARSKTAPKIGADEPEDLQITALNEQQADNDGDDERDDSDTLVDDDEDEDEDDVLPQQSLDSKSNLEAFRTRLSDLTRLAALHNPAILLPSSFNVGDIMNLSTNLNDNHEQLVKSLNQNLVTNALNFQKQCIMTPQSSSSSIALHATNQSQPQLNVDYSKYVRKFDSFNECNSRYCKELNYREHFHCLDCNLRVFIKKDEMIRHFKWHKKREESLQHGFMRYSPTDDCSDKYRDCSHNRKQTHYHCIYNSCDKVYISTSDVQMHANFHRKDSAIAEEGFQRFRATEECKAEYCLFFGQRTTHFHCRRGNCTFTFKNKADMEKHKTFHIKDEQLLKDGFKKFMKNDPCSYSSCKYSKISNHIHCIRPRCTYVLHSSAQLFSHKRKHERQSSEVMYRKFKMAQAILNSLQQQDPNSLNPNVKSLLSSINMDSLESYLNNYNATIPAGDSSGDELSFQDDFDSTHINLDDPTVAAEYLQSILSGVMASVENGAVGDDIWSKYCRHFDANVACLSQDCHFFSLGVEHFHCMLDNCYMGFKSKELVDDHCRLHERQIKITDEFYNSDDFCNETCPLFNNQQKHYHCNWENCNEIVLDTNEKPFRRLDHYKIHERSKRMNSSRDSITMLHLTSSLDSIFNRKRGRPPKNRVIEVWNDHVPGGSSQMPKSPQATFTSFKLLKPKTTNLSDNCGIPLNNNSVERSDLNSVPARVPFQCKISTCEITSLQHYHCSIPHCSFGTEFKDVLDEHESEFHKNFLFFDKDTDCTYPSCFENKINDHYHCLRPNCNMTFTDYNVLETHRRIHDSPQPINLTCQSNSITKADGIVTEISNSQILYGPEYSCSRPFCKLKQKFHYHCNTCNQSFLEIDGLSLHVQKHNVPSSPTEFNFLPPNPLMFFATPPILKRTIPLPPIQDTIVEKRVKVSNYSSSTMRAIKDEPVPEGYSRFRFNEDCRFANCNYREHQTHFHCQRDACAYSFCDKTRFVQHTTRHERLDTLMGNDFLQYRSNVSCNRPNCVFKASLTPGQNKASHFHCLRCDFVCSDTNKVVAHRRFHEKMDTIQAAGFEKFTPSQQCRGGEICPHANKQTHYHCLSCQYTVLGLAQMTAHKYRHVESESVPSVPL